MSTPLTPTPGTCCYAPAHNGYLDFLAGHKIHEYGENVLRQSFLHFKKFPTGNNAR